jgi:fermentation-respiration switch protein FrsA (DUF1100 family)
VAKEDETGLARAESGIGVMIPMLVIHGLFDDICSHHQAAAKFVSALHMREII